MGILVGGYTHDTHPIFTLEHAVVSCNTLTTSLIWYRFQILSDMYINIRWCRHVNLSKIFQLYLTIRIVCECLWRILTVNSYLILFSKNGVLCSEYAHIPYGRKWGAKELVYSALSLRYLFFLLKSFHAWTDGWKDGQIIIWKS